MNGLRVISERCSRGMVMEYVYVADYGISLSSRDAEPINAE